MNKSIHSERSKLLQDQIRSIRQEAGMTQRDLAESLGVNHGTVAKIELGERRVDLVEYYELIAALGANPADEASKLMKGFKKV